MAGMWHWQSAEQVARRASGRRMEVAVSRARRHSGGGIRRGRKRLAWRVRRAIPHFVAHKCLSAYDLPHTSGPRAVPAHARRHISCLHYSPHARSLRCAPRGPLHARLRKRNTISTSPAYASRITRSRGTSCDSHAAWRPPRALTLPLLVRLPRRTVHGAAPRDDSRAGITLLL